MCKITGLVAVIEWFIVTAVQPSGGVVGLGVSTTERVEINQYTQLHTQLHYIILHLTLAG